ncbi:MAG: hypothetical protein ABIB61_01745 [Candidatus Shapirobacteria bacterium]
MKAKLGAINVKRKSGAELFLQDNGNLNFSLLDYWQWANSDLINNTTRGILAEFIVASALGITKGVRKEWDSFDLKYKNLKIEIKSSAYIQSWHQSKYSNLTFGIQPTLAWNPDTNKYSQVTTRQSDIYVFCVLSSKNKRTVNPLNLDQWDFYIIQTKVLNDKKRNQKAISLSSLVRLNPNKAKFNDIKKNIDVLTK